MSKCDSAAARRDAAKAKRAADRADKAAWIRECREEVARKREEARASVEFAPYDIKRDYQFKLPVEVNGKLYASAVAALYDLGFMADGSVSNRKAREFGRALSANKELAVDAFGVKYVFRSIERSSYLRERGQRVR